MKIILAKKLVLANVDGNNNKFYDISCDENFNVHVVNGRVGYDGQTQPVKAHSSESAAINFLEKKVREKVAKGYKEFSDVGGGTTPKGGMSRLALEVAASNQIRTKNRDQIKDLIQHLVSANVHSILSSTTLKYDDDTGLFRTPLGIVTQESIDQARSLLNEIAASVIASDFTSDKVKRLLSDYLMLIPQKVGRKLLVEDVIPDNEAVQRQNGLLDDLEASIAQVAQLKAKKADTPEAQEIEKIFNCEINLVEDTNVIDEITQFYEQKRKSMHRSYGFKVKRVFEVKIDKMDEGFEARGKAVGNIKRLWHGTRAGNVLSILKSGLMIPPASAPHVCGRMFGNGVYFSDESTKSLNYACGYWNGKHEKNCFMFLADVAMGREHIPKHATSNLPAPNTDSTYAIGGKSGVSNNEMIVYSIDQAKVSYLVEFVE